jgi:hypothetical protein
MGHRPRFYCGHHQTGIKALSLYQPAHLHPGAYGFGGHQVCLFKHYRALSALGLGAGEEIAKALQGKLQGQNLNADELLQATGGRMWGQCQARWCSASSPPRRAIPWCSLTRSTSLAGVRAAPWPFLHQTAAASVQGCQLCFTRREWPAPNEHTALFGPSVCLGGWCGGSNSQLVWAFDMGCVTPQLCSNK